MVKCPKCGSTAQPRVVEIEYIEDDYSVEAVRTYKCGCGCVFTGTRFYTCQEQYEIVEEMPKHLLTNYT